MNQSKTFLPILIVLFKMKITAQYIFLKVFSFSFANFMCQRVYLDSIFHFFIFTSRFVIITFLKYMTVMVEEITTAYDLKFHACAII